MLGVARDEPEIAALFDGSPHGPAAIMEGEEATPATPAPSWLSDRFDPLVSESELQALLERATLDLRVNRLRGDVEEVKRQLPEAVPAALSPLGVRLPDGTQVEEHPLWRSGAVEVQDEGSQLLALLTGAKRGEMVVDFCAGAGGKTLALGAMMRNTGRLYAFDVSGHRLENLKPRLARSGLSNVYATQIAHENDERIKRLRGKIDRVLVDAPCSGLGTLRRNPDLKWRQSPKAVEELQVKQTAILNSAARLLKPGGRLVYATCSLMPAENEVIANAFSESHPDFVLLDAKEQLEKAGVAQAETLVTEAGHLRLWPHRHTTDGFYAAAWERKA